MTPACGEEGKKARHAPPFPAFAAVDCRNPFAGGRLQRVRMLLKTTGGNCAPMVQQTLGQLLQQAGLPPYFYWDGDQVRFLNAFVLYMQLCLHGCQYLHVFHV